MTGWVRNTADGKVHTTAILFAILTFSFPFGDFNLRSQIFLSTDIVTSQVEGEAQGDESSVQKLLKDVDRGPRLAHVMKLEKSEIEPKEGENNFSILR